MKLKMPGTVTRTMSRQILILQKHSPTILFVGGVIGVVGTTILASRATLHLEELVDDTQKKLDMAKKAAASTELSHSSYTEEKMEEDIYRIYAQAAVKITKLYGPPVLLGVISISALTGSHRILTKRNAGLTAAYTLVSEAFAAYRRRVVEEFGEEKDREFRYGKEIAIRTVEDTNGPKTKKVAVWGDGGGSMYSRIFDESNRNWDPHLEYNIVFLRGNQNQANDKLRSQGHLFLNEVYDDLGMSRTSAGSQVGWVYKKRDRDLTNGDGYVDFGVFDDRGMLQVHEFVTGEEGGILIDFNVDGPIWELIDRHNKEISRG